MLDPYVRAVLVVSCAPVVAFQHLTCRLSIPLQARPTHARRRVFRRWRSDGGVEPAKVVVSVCTRDSLDKYWKYCAHGTVIRGFGTVQRASILKVVGIAGLGGVPAWYTHHIPFSVRSGLLLLIDSGIGTQTFHFIAGNMGGCASKDKKTTKDVDDTAGNKTDNMVDAAVLEKLEAGFKKLEASDSKSLLKKYLTREVFDNLKTKQTSFGSTLLDCIQSGLENHDSGVGIYAPDAEAYSVFSDLFDPIIEDYHTGFKKSDKHPPMDWGETGTFGNVDPTGEYVVSTRVRCGRSMQGYPFNPCLTEEQYKEMEQKAANACRFWPSGRGIYHNENKTFLVWCNEEDHLRLISMQMGGDLGQVYRRLVTAVNDIEKRVPFSHHDRLGFLTFCPTNLGTTVRASVHIKVPKLAANYAKLEEVAGKYNLQVRGTRGEHTEAEGGIYDISNKRRMGLTEYQAVKEMYDGITELIKIEKEL
ncbi:Arginine kinase 1 [Carabus blaptoides fortunei]